MKFFIHRFFICFTLFISFLIFGHAQTEQDALWTKRATEITKGCTTEYDKAKAIFDWQAENIAYDVSLKIHDAEEGWQKKKGVCQAYSSMFVQLATHCGLEAVEIGGLSKNAPDVSNEESHSWVKVKTEKGWILADPTWGAGSVTNGVFKKNYKPYWFDVNPYWMFFTHYPTQPAEQLLPQAFARVMYDKLPYLTPEMSWWGWDAEETLMFYWGNQDQKPPVVFTLNTEWMTHLKASQAPMFGTLKIGYKYDFKIESLNEQYILGLTGTAKRDIFGEFSKGIQIAPTSEGTIVISLLDTKTNIVHDLLEYKVIR